MRPPNFLPLNLSYIASALINEGIEVDILDIWGRGLSFQEVKQELTCKNYDVYGVSALSTQFNYVSSLTSAIRYLSASPIVMGGALATFSHAEVLSSMPVDVCVHGEGEKTVVELLPALVSGDDLSSIKGIAYWHDGLPVINQPREHIDNLDDLPLPSYEFFDMEAYLSNCCVYSKYGTHDHLPAINVFTGRGCPYHCHFCSRTISGTRFRSIDNVVAEISFLKDRYGIKGVFFNDETLVASRKRVYELCEKIEPFGLRWNCQGRANLMDRELLQAMKGAGCVSVGYGVESGSQRLLDAMNKNQKLEHVIEAINMTVEMGMEPIPQWMFGYPGECEDTIRETRVTFSRFKFPVNPAFICTPLPGTRLYEDTINQGKIHDTVEYHRNLSDGYASVGKVLVNCTSWSDEEFLSRKRELELKVRIGFYLRALLAPKLFPILYREMRMILVRRIRGIAATLRSMGRVR